MKAKPQKHHTTFTLPAIFKEVKKTVSVYLNAQGVAAMKHTPYLRDHSYIACSLIIDDSGPQYLMAQVRYYKGDMNMPKHAYIAIPHSYIKYMVSESPFHEDDAFVELRKIKRN